MSESNKELREYLEEKVEEHFSLTSREAYLSDRSALCVNPQWRMKYKTDRHTIGRRLDRLNAEIMGLAKALSGDSFRART